MPDAYFRVAKDNQHEEYQNTFETVEKYCETGRLDRMHDFVVPSRNTGTSTTKLCIRLRYAERHPHLLIRVRKLQEALSWIHEFKTLLKTLFKNENTKQKAVTVRQELKDFGDILKVSDFERLVANVRTSLCDVPGAET